MERLLPSPIGLCILPEPAPNCARTISYSGTVRELLRHYGIPFADLDADEVVRDLGAIRVLVTVGDGTAGCLPDLRQWLGEGGVWISIGGAAGMPDLLGVEAEAPSHGSWGGGVGMLGEGWLRRAADHPVVAGIRLDLHYFNGMAVRSSGNTTVLADALSRDEVTGTARPALVLNGVGRGATLLIAPDLPGTVARIRQGVAVTRDGVPAPDGTAPICDGVLKSDDGGVLDWARDRQPVPGTEGLRAFLEPIADRWSDLLVRAILWAAERARVTLPILWLYPANLPALGVLSHDSDGNNPKLALTMMEAVADAGIRSTWCVMAPGYPAETVQCLRDAGHELAMHFDAMSEGTEWSEAEFRRQYAVLCDLFGEKPVTNKNHYLRWEGDVEFFEWCVRAGIQVDQSKGASKTGEAGFNFGTCHLYRPVRRDGSIVDVFEMPTPTQDLVVFAPETIASSLIRSVSEVHGVLHLLFHPAHIVKEGVREALLRAIRDASAAGMAWRTAGEVAAWEAARLGCSWSGYWTGTDGMAGVTLHPDADMQQATVLWLDPNGSVERFGVRFTPQLLNLTANERVAVQFNSTTGVAESECSTKD